MNFSFTDEQEELRRYARQWLGERAPTSVIRSLMETDPGYDDSHWKEIAEMGWLGMAIPEEYGGAGFGFLELVVLLEEQGRALFAAPFLSTVILSAHALLWAGSETQKQTWLPRIAAGDAIVTVAQTEPNGRWDATGVETVAAAVDGGWSLNGTKLYVLDGHIADLLIVAARTDAGISLFLVPGDAAGVSRKRLETMDMTRPQAEVTLDGVLVPDDGLLGTEGQGWSILERVNDVVVVALAVEQVGGAQACLDMAVEYAKVRHQFGRPIGSFQAIKHMCADMLVAVESARSAAYYAGWAVSEDNDEVPQVARLAKAYCSEAFFRCAADNIQVHGGIGFTWEHDAHLHLKRAKSSELMFGSPSEHRRRLADLIGL
jgi:alkylation response protein AidB-like acyl-CoA dehydrogenase